jgi:hypothetical protein
MGSFHVLWRSNSSQRDSVNNNESAELTKYVELFATAQPFSFIRPCLQHVAPPWAPRPLVHGEISSFSPARGVAVS